MSMSFETRALDEGVALDARLRGTLRLNLVDRDVLERAARELGAALENPQIRCVLLSGVDDQAFVGGANLHALGGLDGDTAEGFIRSIHDFCALLRHATVPVIAVLRGHCLGAGLEIAAACDIRISDQSLVCGMPEVRVGVPSVVEAALLPALIGWGRTRELLLRGHLIGAEEAHAIGLVQHVTHAAALDDLALAIANDIAAGAPGALAAQKRLMLRWEEVGMQAAIEAGVEAFVAAYREGDEPRRYTERFFARGRKPR
ncbi:MAG: enoyl-CoA hydratase-related protein [Gammaproteobacteria bacterium]